jgi:hypothetical protein
MTDFPESAAMSKFITMFVLCAATAAAAQQQPPKPPSPIHPDTPKPSPVVKLSATTYRLGDVTIDTATKTLTVPGTVNEVPTLEFFANTANGGKAYESALSLRSNAVTFNAALLVLGLDPSRSKASEMQFDKKAPEGDPVELTISWNADGKTRIEPIEELLVDQRSNKTLPKGPWVYTGSRFYDTGEHRLYLAEMDGVLIGFMHSPQAIIDNPRADALGAYGFYVINPRLGLKGGTPITLTVKAMPRGK